MNKNLLQCGVLDDLPIKPLTPWYTNTLTVGVSSDNKMYGYSESSYGNIEPKLFEDHGNLTSIRVSNSNDEVYINGISAVGTKLNGEGYLRLDEQSNYVSKCPELKSYVGKTIKVDICPGSGERRRRSHFALYGKYTLDIDLDNIPCSHIRIKHIDDVNYYFDFSAELVEDLTYKIIIDYQYIKPIYKLCGALSILSLFAKTQDVITSMMQSFVNNDDERSFISISSYKLSENKLLHNYIDENTKGHLEFELVIPKPLDMTHYKDKLNFEVDVDKVDFDYTFFPIVGTVFADVSFGDL